MNIKNEETDNQKPVWSATFWRDKILRSLIAILLLIVLVFVWNWDTSDDNEVVDTPTTNTVGQQTDTLQQEETEQETEPAFPYEITLPAGSTEVPVMSNLNDVVSYAYTLDNGATITVYPDGPAPSAADIVWQYQSDDSGNITVTDRADSVCVAGTANCTAGNGQLEISIVPQVGDNAKLTAFILETDITSRTVAEWADYYEPIINTIKVNQ